MLSKQIEILNRHLAESKKSLETLISEGRPNVRLRDGSEHIFKKDELEKICKIIPDCKNLMLPIYIELGSSKYGKGTARVAGRLECSVIASIIGRDASGDELFIYKPELKKIRKELPTTTQYMFVVSQE